MGVSGKQQKSTKDKKGNKSILTFFLVSSFLLSVNKIRYVGLDISFLDQEEDSIAPMLRDKQGYADKNRKRLESDESVRQLKLEEVQKSHNKSLRSMEEPHEELPNIRPVKTAIVMRGMDPLSKTVMDRLVLLSNVMQKEEFQNYDLHVLLDQTITKTTLTTTNSIQQYFQEHNASHLKAPNVFGVTENMIRKEFPKFEKGYMTGTGKDGLVDGTKGKCCGKPFMWQLLLPTFVTFTHYHPHYDYAWVYEDDVWSIGTPIAEVFRKWDEKMKGRKVDIAGIKLNRDKTPYNMMTKERQTYRFRDILIEMKATHWQRRNETLFRISNQTQSSIWNSWGENVLPRWSCMSDSFYRHSREFSNYVYGNIAENIYQFAECFQQPLAWKGGFNITDMKKLLTGKEKKTVHWNPLFRKISYENAVEGFNKDKKCSTFLYHEKFPKLPKEKAPKILEVEDLTIRSSETNYTQNAEWIAIEECLSPMDPHTDLQTSKRTAVVMRGMDPLSKTVMDRLVELSNALDKEEFQNYDLHVLLDQTKTTLTTTDSVQQYFQEHNASHLKAPNVFGVTENMIRKEFPKFEKGYMTGRGEDGLVDGTKGKCCRKPFMWQLLLPAFVTFTNYHPQYDYAWVYEDDVWSIGTPIVEVFRKWDEKMKGRKVDIAGVRIDRGHIPYTKMTRERQTYGFREILIEMKGAHWQRKNATLLRINNQTRSPIWNTWCGNALPPWSCISDSFYRHSREFSNYVYDNIAENIYQFTECFQQPLAWKGGFNITDLQQLLTAEEAASIGWGNLFKKISYEVAMEKFSQDQDSTAFLYHEEFPKPPKKGEKHATKRLEGEIENHATPI